MCVTAAYDVQCLVAGCRGSGARQQAIRPGRGMLHDCNIPLPGHTACFPVPSCGSTYCTCSADALRVHQNAQSAKLNQYFNTAGYSCAM